MKSTFQKIDIPSGYYENTLMVKRPVGLFVTRIFKAVVGTW